MWDVSLPAMFYLNYVGYKPLKLDGITGEVTHVLSELCGI